MSDAETIKQLTAQLRVLRCVLLVYALLCTLGTYMNAHWRKAAEESRQLAAESRQLAAVAIVDANRCADTLEQITRKAQ